VCQPRIHLYVSPCRCGPRFTPRGEALPRRCSRTSPSATTLTRVRPPSRRSGGTTVRCHGRAARATPWAAGHGPTNNYSLLKTREFLSIVQTQLAQFRAVGSDDVPGGCGDISQAHLLTVTGAQRPRCEGSQGIPVALGPLRTPSQSAVRTHNPVTTYVRPPGFA
jgi:hypothetical protein